MRTSNKILLIFFLTPVFIITILFAAIRIKYENGSISSAENIREERFERHVVQNVSYVKISGLQNLRIIPSDTLKLEVEKNPHGWVRYRLKGDTLLIKGDTMLRTSPNTTVHRRSDQYVRLFLPEDKEAFAYWSAVSLQGSDNPVNAPSYNLQLVSSELQLRKKDLANNTSMAYYERLSVGAINQSSVNLLQGCQIDKLEIELKDHSLLNEQEATIRNIHLISDDSSIVKLHGSYLRKLQTAAMRSE